MHEARVMIRRIARQRGVREFAQQLYDKIMKASVHVLVLAMCKDRVQKKINSKLTPRISTNTQASNNNNISYKVTVLV